MPCPTLALLLWMTFFSCYRRVNGDPNQIRWWLLFHHHHHIIFPLTHTQVRDFADTPPRGQFFSSFQGAHHEFESGNCLIFKRELLIRPWSTQFILAQAIPQYPNTSGPRANAKSKRSLLLIGWLINSFFWVNMGLVVGLLRSLWANQHDVEFWAKTPEMML